MKIPDMPSHDGTGMAGLRVFAMLPPYTEERAEYLVELLSIAKRRWAWQIDLFCQESDRKTFINLVMPSGRLWTIPDIVQRAAWENNSTRVVEAERRFKEAENATHVTAGQLVLASQATIGSAFVAPVYRAMLTRITASVLKDDSKSFRIIRRLFIFADDMIEAARPDLILAYEWEKPWRSTVWMAASRRGIPCVAIRRSKLNADHYYWTTDRTLFNTASRESAFANGRAEVPLSEAAAEYIRRFREAPRTVKYVEAKWLQQGQKTWLAWHVNFARTVLRQLANVLAGRAKKKWLLQKLVGYNVRAYLEWRQRDHFRSIDEIELRELRYIYFPMHKETDLPLVFQAPRWHDQRNTIQLLAGFLPSGYRLLVREHRLNVGRRPSGYYRDIKRLPNVVLVDPFGSQFKYINNADLIVTETGTSGWEGLLFGRRVLTLSRTSYDGAGLTTNVGDPDQLGVAILSALQVQEPSAASVTAV